MTIRAATPADAPGIARVHVDSWRTTYRGLMPDALLDQLSYERRQQYWAGVLANAESPTRVFVADDDGQIVGFAAGGPSRAEALPYAGELYAIYLLGSHQRAGGGRRLAQALVARLAQAGLRSLLVWVLAGNQGARRFYEALGGRQVQVRPETIGGVTLEEVGYGWDDTAILEQALHG